MCLLEYIEIVIRLAVTVFVHLLLLIQAQPNTKITQYNTGNLIWYEPASLVFIELAC